jgi:hypothetical protein
VFEANVAKLLLIDAASILASAGSAVIKKLFGSDSKMNGAHRDLKEKITKLMGEDNLVGSAGEFGLLFAFLANSPRSTDNDEPAVSLDDVRSMFVEKRLPNGWERWEKTQWNWLRNTTGLLVSAAAAYHELKAKDSEACRGSASADDGCSPPLTPAVSTNSEDRIGGMHRTLTPTMATANGGARRLQAAARRRSC